MVVLAWALPTGLLWAMLCLRPFVDEQLEALEPHSAHGRVLLVLLPLLLGRTWSVHV